MNKNVMKWVGVGAIGVGSVALYLSGTSESAVTSIVGAVFVLVGIVAAIIKG